MTYYHIRVCIYMIIIFNDMQQSVYNVNMNTHLIYILYLIFEHMLYVTCCLLWDIQSTISSVYCVVYYLILLCTRTACSVCSRRETPARGRVSTETIQRCLYACMYIHKYVYVYTWTYVHTYPCAHVCPHVRMYGWLAAGWMHDMLLSTPPALR